jgi:hypothetical protein
VNVLADLAVLTNLANVPDSKEQILLTQSGFAQSVGDIDLAVALFDAQEASGRSRRGHAGDSRRGGTP